MYHRLSNITRNLQELRDNNYKEMTGDRMRCQHCQGFYWRLWHDQAQCLACQDYSAIEVGKFENSNQLILPIDLMPNSLLRVDWIREQLLGKNGIDDNKRVLNPVSGRSEFIIYADRLKCRVTGIEILIQPEITGYWIMQHWTAISNRVVTDEEALNIVKQSKEDSHARNGDYSTGQV
jgi:hypothetical protein